MNAKRMHERIIDRPCVIDVYERIVHHVKRVRYCSKELAYPCRCRISYLSARTDAEDQRKHDKQAEQFENPVCGMGHLTHPAIPLGEHSGTGNHDDSDKRY